MALPFEVGLPRAFLDPRGFAEGCPAIIMKASGPRPGVFSGLAGVLVAGRPLSTGRSRRGVGLRSSWTVAGGVGLPLVPGSREDCGWVVPRVRGVSLL